MVQFDTHEDLWEKVIYFAGNDLERRKIAEAGYNSAREQFDVEKVCGYILDVAFGQQLSNTFRWPTDAVKAP